MATAEVPNEDTTATVGVTFEHIVEDMRSDFGRDEKRRRHEAYAQFGFVMDRLMPETGAAEALHMTYADVHNETAERTVFLCRGNMPDHGTLLRVIVNDELHQEVSGGRVMEIRDFVISTVQKTLTYQHSRLERVGVAQWNNTQAAGPLLHRRNDRLDVVSGPEYDVLIPKTRGYPHSLDTLMANRVLIEGLAEDLSHLSEANAEVGYPSRLGILS